MLQSFETDEWDAITCSALLRAGWEAKDTARGWSRHRFDFDIGSPTLGTYDTMDDVHDEIANIELSSKHGKDIVDGACKISRGICPAALEGLKKLQNGFSL